MNLYPQLPLMRTRELIGDRRSRPVDELEGLARHWDDEVVFGAVGGSRVNVEDVSRLQMLVRDRRRAAMAETDDVEAARRRFDAEVAALLYAEMAITPHEAAQGGIWAFLSVIVLPEAVRWRFPGDATGTVAERFAGGSRGLRNTFGRLWWRSHALVDRSAVDPFTLVRAISEDEAVAIIERPSIAGHPPLARALMRTLLMSGVDTRGIARATAMREVAKRVRRVAGARPLELLTEAELNSEVSSLLAEVETRLAPAGQAYRSAQVAAAELHGRAMVVEPETRPSSLGAVFMAVTIAGDELGGVVPTVRVPDNVVPLLPELNESYVNPERNLVVVDQDDRRWLWRYVNYNHTSLPVGDPGRGHMIVGLGAFLETKGARPGGTLTFALGDNDQIRVLLA